MISTTRDMYPDGRAFQWLWRAPCRSSLSTPSKMFELAPTQYSKGL